MGTRRANGEAAPPTSTPYLTTPPDSAAQLEPSSAHFVAECFFITQTMVHTALMPAGGLLHRNQSRRPDAPEALTNQAAAVLGWGCGCVLRSVMEPVCTSMQPFAAPHACFGKAGGQLWFWRSAHSSCTCSHQSLVLQSTPAAARPVAPSGARATPNVLMIPQHASPGPVGPSHHGLLEAVQLSHHLGCPVSTERPSLKLLCQEQMSHFSSAASSANPVYNDAHAH